MRKCLVPNCPSVYKPGGKNIHFFTFPKNPETFEIWKNAFEGTKIDFKDYYKNNKLICEAHFSKSDILYQRVLKNSEGVVFGVSPYSRVQLKKGAVPKVSMNKSEDKGNCENTDETESKFKKPIRCYSSNKKTDKKILTEHEIKSEEKQLKDYCSVRDIINDKTILIPDSWTRVLLVNDNDVIAVFSHLVPVRNGGKIKAVLEKEIIIYENMDFEINILSQSFDSSSLTTCKKISAKCDIQSLINAIDSRKVCEGLALPKDMKIKSNFIHVDSKNTMRHVKCLLLSENELCSVCKEIGDCLRKIHLEKEQEITIGIN